MIQALLFDVFGTVVDWRSGISKDFELISKKYGLKKNSKQFADDWRAEYQPSMEKVRSRNREFVKLDILHDENLKNISNNYGLDILSNEDWDWLVKSWHRLPGWKDSSKGLLRLKSKFIIASQSNGNIELILNMSKNSKLYWDMILGSEVVGYYKPQPEAYLVACEKVGLNPNECMMVAAHNSDLSSARKVGLKTAFVLRSNEHGINQKSDLKPLESWDYVANDFFDLADKLGCEKEVTLNGI